MAQESPASARAFNRGADARIAGQPLSSCPCPDPDDRRYWHMGWRHAHYFWGTEAKWPVPELPEVRLAS